MLDTGLRITGLCLLAMAVASCQSSGRRYAGRFGSELDGPVRISTPIRQLKPACSSDPRQILGKKLTECFDPTYLALSRNPLSAEQARAYLSGNTTRSYNAVHGTQVSYEAPDGFIYLWYPGNTKVLKGEWRVVSKESVIRSMFGRGAPASTRKIPGTFICYRYGANTYNPATRRRGAVWECQDATISIRSQIKEKAAGDIFNLVSGEVPYVMPHGSFSLAKLKKKP